MNAALQCESTPGSSRVFRPRSSSVATPKTPHQSSADSAVALNDCRDDDRPGVSAVDATVADGSISDAGVVDDEMVLVGVESGSLTSRIDF